MNVVTHCRDAVCGVPLIRPRQEPLRGARRHGGRGLCRPCFDRHRRDGTLYDYPSYRWKRADLYEEWCDVREIEPAITIAAAARRIGVSREALEVAIRRTERGYTPATTRTFRSAEEVLALATKLLDLGFSRRRIAREINVDRKRIQQVLTSAGWES